MAPIRNSSTRGGIAVLLLCVLVGGCQASRRWEPGEKGAYEQLALPFVTRTASGKPGDPINVGLIGETEEIARSLVLAGWQPADAVTLKSSLRIVKSVLLKRPDPNAPVSNLYLWGRPQDIAFEQEVNGSPRQRHHVRLWASDVTVDGKLLWIGSATYDSGVYLRKFSHHIASDVDAEHAYFLNSLTNANITMSIAIVPGVGTTAAGRNGEGDAYFTDGRILIGWIKALHN